jgi:hypothetical protein
LLDLRGSAYDQWMRTASIGVTLAVVAAFAAGLGVGTGVALAHPADVFAGQIVTARKPIPSKAKSQSAFVKEVRKLKASTFQEDEELKSWKVYFAAFFAKELRDLEVTIRLYDITGGKQKSLYSFEQYLDRSGDRVVNSSIVLERSRVGVNRTLLITMEHGGKVIARGSFVIVGEGPKYKGNVDFTEDGE